MIAMAAKTNDILERMHADPTVKAGYERRKEIIAIARMIRSWRQEAKLTQEALAERLDMKQSAIARLESLDNDSVPNIDTLKRIAEKCGARMIIGAHWGASNAAHFAEALQRDAFIEL